MTRDIFNCGGGMDKEDKENQIEEAETKTEQISHRGGSILRYKIPIIIIIAFVAGVLLTNSINGSISGAIISGLENENENILSTGSIQKTSLELEKTNLLNEIEKLNDGLGFYKGLVEGLEKEKIQTITAPLRNRIEFEVIWDKYIIAKQDEEYVWNIRILNLDDISRSFSTELKIKSNRDEVFARVPATGSLTLTPDNSGNLEVKLIPENSGYAIFEMYVNTHYIGDLIVFSR
jgi:hypothetical protein